MKLGLSLLICLLFQFISFTLKGQEYSSHKKAQRAFEKAAVFLNQKKYTEAINQLKVTIEFDPTFARAVQQLADLYRIEKKYNQAIPLYKKVLILNPNLTPLTYFGLGESLLAEGEYQSALPYLIHYSKGKLTDKGALITHKYILDCEFAQRQSFNTTYVLQKLPRAINTGDNEYFPKLTADSRKIIFTRKTDNQENFYESDFINDQWTDAHKLVGIVNSDFFNEGAHCIAPDGKYLFFTGCNRPQGLGSCDIYISKLENNIWGAPQNLGPPLNSSSWESQPAISADGRTLYFVSNRAGGYGGNDIWKSELKENGTWGIPTNLGNTINTPFDESSPFIHADNKTLYFASNGWPGFGQADLYLSRLTPTGTWSLPVNLGAPINNHLQQNSVQITIDGNIGFLSSQDSSKQLDIYTFAVPNTLKPNPIAYILGNIYDRESKLPLIADIIITNTATQEIIYRDQSYYDDGKFLATLPVGANYALHIQKEGYLFHSEQYNLEQGEVQNKEFYKEILLQPIKKGESLQMNNIYFETDKYELLPESYAELHILVNFLKTNPTTRIEISGHTDNTGTSTKNQLLSENRAKAVQNYLIGKDIAPKRLISVGYGDHKPLAVNKTTAGRQLNRRTEVQILN